ncbi:MAG: phasin, PhaP, partial [Pseudomonadota bacterium]
LAAGKDMSEDATAAVKKATNEVTNVAKKAAAAAK